MLKKLELQDAFELHSYLVDPSVYPFVRYKAESLDEYLFVTKQVIEKEEKNELIMRVILDEHAKPIGQIALYDIMGSGGFLGTWLGTSFHGKGYNQLAKENFFTELFYQLNMESVYMKIRRTNEKSRKAALKLPYVEEVNQTKPFLFDFINQDGYIYDLFEIRKELYQQFRPSIMEA